MYKVTRCGRTGCLGDHFIVTHSKRVMKQAVMTQGDGIISNLLSEPMQSNECPYY